MWEGMRAMRKLLGSFLPVINFTLKKTICMPLKFQDFHLLTAHFLISLQQQELGSIKSERRWKKKPGREGPVPDPFLMPLVPDCFG